MMKSTGIVRKVDGLGRVVIPMELRRTLGIDVRDPLEIFIDGNRIILQKYAPNDEIRDVMEGLERLKESSNGAEKELLERAIKIIK